MIQMDRDASRLFGRLDVTHYSDSKMHSAAVLLEMKRAWTFSRLF
jgi:hypothetical protein